MRAELAVALLLSAECVFNPLTHGHRSVCHFQTFPSCKGSQEAARTSGNFSGYNFMCVFFVVLRSEVEQAGLSDLEVISQPVEEENQCLAPPVQLLSFGYRDLPLAALDLSLAGSQLLSNADEDETRDG